MVPDGETVQVGTPLAEIDAEGGAAAAEAPAAEPRRAEAPAVEETPAEAPAPPRPTPAQARRPSSEQGRRRQPAEAEPPPPSHRHGAEPAAAGAPQPAAAVQAPPTRRAAPSDGNGAAARMTPAVRRLVREHDIDITQLNGSGAGGRVTRDDVLPSSTGRGRTAPGRGAGSSAPARGRRSRRPLRLRPAAPRRQLPARSGAHAAGARSRHQPAAMSRSR